MEKLLTLHRGDKFKHKSFVYTVYNQDGNMTEVYGNGRYWAWPNCVNVQRLTKHE